VTQPTDPATSVAGSVERSFEIAVNGLIGAYDLSANPAVQSYITQVLARVGVQHVEVPPGTSFDPVVHEAVSTIATDEPDRVNRVAATLRPGWRGSNEVLRPPQVSVWIA
jgi:GrpE